MGAAIIWLPKNSSLPCSPRPSGLTSELVMTAMPELYRQPFGNVDSPEKRRLKSIRK
jgi:hypothetical protein